MKAWKLVLIVAVVALLAALSFVHFGVFNIAADEPHSKMVFWLTEKVREESIAARSADVEIPNLDDPDLLLTGGPDFNEMCTGCHLKPGQKDSELSLGLYPQPPNLSKLAAERHHSDVDTDRKHAAARQFWIIKHGLKMTGMPAWGPTHDDQRIWAMVAFLQRLPDLTPEQYQVLTARAEGDMGHSHGDDEAMDMPGMGDEHGAHEHGEHAHDEASGSMAEMAGMSGMGSAADSPKAAVEAFHAALKSGDVDQATALLLPQALIYEGGGAERSRAEYVQSHMREDMAFMKTAEIHLLKSAIQQVGDAGWATSESRIRGSSGGKPFDVLSTETVILKREAGTWRIAHIHWSSQRYVADAAK